MDTDRNLLFGVLAMQADLIDAERFAEACAAWAARKATPLAELLVERGWIDAEGRADVEKLLARKLRRHGGDAHASLAEAIDGRARAALEALSDSETRQTLDDLSPIEAGPPLTTIVLDDAPPGPRYQPSRLIGRGGLGQVWLALDGDLGREVALKEIRPDRAEVAEIRARFLEEARITGQLQHPGIVPVFELGRPGDGRSPYYTMRFVRGRTLSEAIRDYHRATGKGSAGPLERSALLDAFVGVCNAVAYAHSRGVIHRDLKGQNVVLGKFGEVIVLDWGLAKLDGQIDEPTCSIPPLGDGRPPGQTPTITGRVMGTPAYMAPEQAEGHWERVDRRSDIYSLGAILYEILTGVPPFHGPDTAEVLRRVIQEPPVPPRQVRPEVPAALEAIALKALAKRPEDRFESAAELATEVRRFQADEPVAAYRESIAARAARWARKHQAAVVGAAVLMVTALVALSIGVWSVRREQRRTLAERDRAEQNFRQARRAVDEYLTRVSESKLLNTPGLQPLRKELLDAALKYYQGFIQQRGNDPAVRAELAEAYHRAGNIDAALGHWPESVAALRAGRAILEGLQRRQPDRESHRIALANLDFDLGAVLGMLGQRAEAVAAYQRSLATRQELVRAHPGDKGHQADVASAQTGLAIHLQADGELKKAEAAYQAPVATLKKLARDAPAATRSTARNRLNLASMGLVALLSSTGRLDEAATLCESILHQRQELVKRNPDSLDDRFALALNHQFLATIRQQQGRLAVAEENYRAAVQIGEALVRANPAVTNYRLELGTVRIMLADVRRRRGDRDAFEAEARAGLELLRAVFAEHPGSRYYRELLATTLDQLGDSYREANLPEPARGFYREAVELLRALVHDEPRDVNFRSKLAWCLNDLGLIRSPDRLNEVESANREALGVWDQLVHDRPKDPALAVSRATTLINMGLFDDARDRTAAALDWFARAITDMTPLAAMPRPPEGSKVQLRRGLTSRAATLTKLGKHAEAVADWDRIIALDGETKNLTPRLARLAALARMGEHARAIADGEALLKGQPRKPGDVYDLACVLALASVTAAADPRLAEPDRAAAAERAAARAVGLLREAGDLGIFRRPGFLDHMRKDADLDGLRSRADYQALLQELTRSAAPTP